MESGKRVHIKLQIAFAYVNVAQKLSGVNHGLYRCPGADQAEAGLPGRQSRNG
jgi:hypothetical protein